MFFLQSKKTKRTNGIGFSELVAPLNVYTKSKEVPSRIVLAPGIKKMLCPCDLVNGTLLVDITSLHSFTVACHHLLCFVLALLSTGAIRFTNKLGNDFHTDTYTSERLIIPWLTFFPSSIINPAKITSLSFQEK